MNQRLKFTFTLTLSVLFLLLLSLIAFGQSKSKSDSNKINYLITANSAGDIKLGMTVGEAKKAMKDARFSRSSDGDGVALIAVGNSDETYMTLYADEEDNEAPINENAKIEFIEVWHSQFKTAEGIHVKMKIVEVESKYGKLKNIMMSEIESREFADFADQPKAFGFRLSAGDSEAGIYAEGKNETTKYNPETYIMTISISSPPQMVD